MWMWMWMSTIIILFGAELNSEIEHQTAIGSTTGGRKPIGSRGAKMAGTVGAAQKSPHRKYVMILIWGTRGPYASRAITAAAIGNTFSY